MSTKVNPPILRRMTFKEWAKANPDIVKCEKCSRCHGDGAHDCPHCDQIMDCRECGGSGLVYSQDQRAVYEAQLTEDMRRLERAALSGMVVTLDMVVSQ